MIATSGDRFNAKKLATLAIIQEELKKLNGEQADKLIRSGIENSILSKIDIKNLFGLNNGNGLYLDGVSPLEYYELVIRQKEFNTPKLFFTTGNIWRDFEFSMSEFIVIPINKVVDKNGDLVMGAGLARNCKSIWRERKIEAELGSLMRAFDFKKNVFFLKVPKVIAFATKEHWRDKSNSKIIKKSLLELKSILLNEEFELNEVVRMPKIGCGLGGMNWPEVKKMILDILEFEPRKDHYVSRVNYSMKTVEVYE